ncbi:MAG: hypothetical protein IPK34_03790 [Ramlibacter sp.]|jgi:hypothetical protein|nr:hypothetical protein [Ramlibacter sp.]
MSKTVRAEHREMPQAGWRAIFSQTLKRGFVLLSDQTDMLMHCGHQCWNADSKREVIDQSFDFIG